MCAGFTFQVGVPGTPLGMPPLPLFLLPAFVVEFISNRPPNPPPHPLLPLQLVESILVEKGYYNSAIPEQELLEQSLPPPNFNTSMYPSPSQRPAATAPHSTNPGGSLKPLAAASSLPLPLPALKPLIGAPSLNPKPGAGASGLNPKPVAGASSLNPKPGAGPPSAPRKPG